MSGLRASADAPDARVISVIGSRGYPQDHTEYVLAEIGKFDRLVSGGARDVDQLAERWAADHGAGVTSYRPRKGAAGGYIVEEWRDNVLVGAVVHPKTGEAWVFPDFPSAAKRRNWWIVRDGTEVHALWDGMSSGTAHGIAAATRLGRELRIWMEGDS